MKMNRRKFLKYSSLAGTALATGGLLVACGDTTAAPAQTPALSATGYAGLDPKDLNNFNNPLNLPGGGGVLGVLDVSSGQLELVAKPASLELLKGKKADLFTYQVSQAGKTFINPIFWAKKGETFLANLTNNLSEETNIHWHGLHVDWHMDGHPSQLIAGGAAYRYSYQVQNRGGTYWYHPHPHKLTPKQAYSGLASFYIVDDEDNQRLAQSLDLKFGETDLPVVIQDKLFDESGKLFYPTDANTQFMGLVGDTILANLTVNPSLEVSTRVYRLRFLNGSNARTYRLAFVKGKGNEKLPYWLIGTDGGLMDKPYQVSEVFLSPGERIEVLIDLKNLAIGDIVALKSLAFDPMHSEMSGMNMGGSSGNSGSMGGMQHGGMTMSNPTPNSSSAPASKLEDGQEFYILKLVVKNKVNYDRVIPQTLSNLTKPDTTGASTRTVVLSQAMMVQGGQMMQWLINGKSFQMEEYPITVKKNSTEIWEFRNEQQSMPHPMHLHGFSFQILERRNSPAQLKGLATYDQGRLPTDLGWKDTVLIWPGETVRLALDFSHNFEGEQTYVTHCHVLEHEGNGMMLNYQVI